MKLSVRFLPSLYISLLCISISSSVFAVQTQTPERWFEIEVILFKQLGDKTSLKEKFPDNVSATNLPQYKKHFDLLTSYLQPNLTGIKQFMPVCGKTDTQDVLFESLPHIHTHFSDAISDDFFDTVSAIEYVDTFTMPEFGTDHKAVVQQDHNHMATKITQNNAKLSNGTIEHTPQKTPLDLFNTHNDSLISAQQKKHIFELQKQLASPLFSTQNICLISRKDIEKLFTDEQLANFQLDAFDVESLPTKLNASGAHMSDRPYLIANESLLLADIKQRLQWSSEFRPLLHFGWRQIGVTRDKAIPLKLVAGNNLDYEYHQALDNYQSALDEAKLAEQLALQQSSNLEGQEVDDLAAQIQQKKEKIADIKQQKLSQVFIELETIDSANINGLINSLEQQKFKEFVDIHHINRDESEQLNISNPPVKPLQPWVLNGFLKVHLDHYLYITADFNIISQSLDKSTNNATNKPSLKLINFSQNKRVISGEIHYFDHPYMGMIVQIRRFDPSKPKGEAVTQVIN
jgi:hypothetical protein